jgi:hypothetical protein
MPVVSDRNGFIKSTPGLYGFIWFERFGSDKKRTIINELLAFIGWNAIVQIGLIQGPIL